MKIYTEDLEAASEIFNYKTRMRKKKQRILLFVFVSYKKKHMKKLA